MSEISARLDLPLIQPSQAQKHVTHNEALLRLDSMTQTVISEFDIDVPPVNPVDGQIYALGGNPTGEWAGRAGHLAIRMTGAWMFITPKEGWHAWDLIDEVLKVYNTGTWASITQDMNNLQGVGVNSAWDSLNRLSVSAQASLFNHEGAGHQLKVNKAASADTASLLFQSGFTGHAEMGLSGDTAFAIRVSADGGTWLDVMRADPSSEEVTINLPITGQAVQQSPDDVTPGRLMRADWGYSPSTVLGTVSEVGGTPNGALLETDNNANGQYSRWADGTQICMFDSLTIEANNSATCLGTWTFPAVFSHAPTYVNVILPMYSSAWAPSNLRASVAYAGVHSAPSPVSADLGFYASDGEITATVSECRCMAIGRWF